MTSQAEPHASSSAVDVSRFDFTTSDGWNIGGVLFRPPDVGGSRSPAVLLLAEPGRRILTILERTAMALAQNGLVALSIDLRGSGSSHGTKDFEDFSPREIATLEVDIHDALGHLRQLEFVDNDRLAIIAPGFTADFAVRAAIDDSAIRAVVTLAGELTDESSQLIESKDRLRLLVVVGANQPKALQRIWSEPYFRSTNRATEMLFGADHGPALLTHSDGLNERVVEWLTTNVGNLPIRQSIEVTSSDGWVLRGLLRVPAAASQKPAPGVVFVHGRNHSAQSWSNLPEDLAHAGYATLNFDWRGTRKSGNPTRGVVGVDFADELKNIPLDVKAAVEFLARTEGVDSTNIALIAATAACNDAIVAAIGDDRIRTIVGLTFERPRPEVIDYLTTHETPILVVASAEDVRNDGLNMAITSKSVYDASSSRNSQFLLYDDAGRGNGMLSSKPELNGMIRRWLDEHLRQSPKE